MRPIGPIVLYTIERSNKSNKIRNTHTHTYISKENKQNTHFRFYTETYTRCRNNTPKRNTRSTFTIARSKIETECMKKRYYFNTSCICDFLI